MKIMRIAIIVFLSVIILSLLFYKFLDYQASLQYKDSTPPSKTADSLKSLVASLIQGEEAFAGSINVTFIDPDHNGLWNKAEIKVLNKVIYDDSIGPIEYLAIAEQKDGVWKITRYKSHWKCKRHVIPQFWQTSACI